MKNKIAAKTFSSALAAILAGSFAGTAVYAYDGNYDYIFTYDGDSVSADTDADGAVSTASYTIDGTVISISGVGTYVVSGSSDNGSITVEKNSDGVTLIFENLTLTSADEDTVTVGKNSDVDIIIEGDSTLTNTNEDGAVIKIKSGASVTVTGTGELTVDASEGKNGIKGASEATLTIGEDESDSFTLTVSAANNGIASDGSVVVNGGTINITSDGDGLKSSPDEDDTVSEGTVTVNNGNISIVSAEDGVQADGGFTMNDGTLNIVSGGGASNAGNLDEDTSAKGIKSDSYIVIAGGDITIDSADDGIHLNGTDGDEAITITNGSITIAAGDDGIHSDYELNIGTEGSDEGPDINITKSYEGLEGATVNLYSGTGSVTASDDGINAANSDLSGYDFEINIDGGTWYINANGDGIDSNGDINVSGGDTAVFGAADNGNAAIDVGDNGGQFNVTGGSISGIGMSGMAVVPTSGTYLQFGSAVMGGFGQQQSSAGNISVSSGASVEIRDSEGNTVYSATAVKNANSIVFASDELESGKSYTLYINGKSVSQTTAAEGNGVSGGMGGMGGQPGQMPDMPNGGNGQPGQIPDMPNGGNGQQGQMPDMPNGGNGQQGQMPDMPNGGNGQQQGQMPDMPNGRNGQQGQMPDMPNGGNGQQGQMPDMPNGDNGQQGQMPDMPNGGNGQPGQMPDMPNGGNGQQQGQMPGIPNDTSAQQQGQAPSFTSNEIYAPSQYQASVNGSGTYYSSYYIPQTQVIAEAEETADDIKETAAEALTEYLSEVGGVASFREIEAVFDKVGFDYRGENYIAVKKNLVVWYGWSDEAVELLNTLIKDEKVMIVIDRNRVYSGSNDKLSALPEASELADQKELHWLPAAIELC